MANGRGERYVGVGDIIRLVPFSYRCSLRIATCAVRECRSAFDPERPVNQNPFHAEDMAQVLAPPNLAPKFLEIRSQ